MARLAIRKFWYDGDIYAYESPFFDDGINVMEGSNGTGKSTFFELIYYCLGGSPDMLNPSKPNKHVQIFADKNNFVALLVQINKSLFTIKRYIGSNDIAVELESHEIKLFPIFRREPDNRYTFSDWFLSQLQIEPIELALGTTTWIINLKDIFRLIYHDQAPNPNDVYKTADSANFISDSKVMRKAIFEVLVGKHFHEYYKALGEYRKAEIERHQVRGAVDLYKSMVAEIHTPSNDLNLEFLKQQLNEKLQQLERLEKYLDEINSSLQPPSEGLIRIESIKSQVLTNEIDRSNEQEKERALLEELIKLRKLKNDLITEVTQITKMIYTHERLKLFSGDTCPYCLRDVERTKGKCVCGAAIDESEYERFFYSSAEYSDILKAKQKSVETINTAIQSCDREMQQSSARLKAIDELTIALRAQLTELVNQVDKNIDVAKLNEVTGAISILRKDVDIIEHQIKLEGKRQELEDKLHRVVEQHKFLKKNVDKHLADADLEMDSRLNQFNDMYNNLMKKTVADCRRAYLDPDYMPVINDGEYREASAAVPRRLMYYFTLLNLSLTTVDVSFPRFLLVDTPETSGIDLDNLIKSLNCINEVVPENQKENYQLILSTGLGKYPPSFSKFIVATLTEKEKLLKRKTE